jgi:hypothetical protein
VTAKTPVPVPGDGHAYVPCHDPLALCLVCRWPGYSAKDHTPRLGHCTGTFAGHSPACDRDGTYCSLSSTHTGPCKPHGGSRGAS